jgi:hypothetical protein
MGSNNYVIIIVMKINIFILKEIYKQKSGLTTKKCFYILSVYFLETLNFFNCLKTGHSAYKTKFKLN